ncbi:MAG: glycosyltransferase family 9 protein [Betaproteobacteria bacterium]|nr:glycosyltransferase family 9 protein [Betaproteobacteria bacterium]
MTAGSGPDPRQRSPRILLIRRDNIGDLVCTTPLIAALRQRHPGAYIAALVNSYNRDVLDGNPTLDEVFDYTKGKHREPGTTLFATYAGRVRLFMAMRRRRFDFAVLAAPHFQPHALCFARASGARHVVGFVDGRGAARIDHPVSYGSGATLHEAEDVFRLGAPLGVSGEPPSARVFPQPATLVRVRTALGALPGGPVVAMHISARKPSQRWPAERYVEAMHELHRRGNARFILLWAPGSDANPMHPGDDEKAASVSREAGGLGLPLLSWPTARLPELVAALAASDAVLCSDGGAMHLAAALGRPIACLFGDSSPARWHPWACPHVVLQSPGRVVDEVPVSAAVAAVMQLLEASRETGA